MLSAPEGESQEHKNEITKRSEAPLAIPQGLYEGLASIHSAGEVLRIWPTYNMQENIQRIRAVLRESPPQKILEYIQDVQQVRHAKRFPKEPETLVVPWTDEVAVHGKSLLDEFLDQREKHPLIVTLKSLKKSALAARESLGESIFDTKRYLKFFFPRLPLDETEEIRFDAIIPTMKKILWGAYENTGIPFRTHGKVERILEKEEPIMTGPFLPGNHYEELAQILYSDLATFASNLGQIVNLTQNVREELDVEEAAVCTFDAKRRLASAVNIASHTSQEILSQPDSPRSGILGMYLLGALKEIQEKVDPLIGEDASEYRTRKALVPQINYILEPRYSLFISVLKDQGFRWEKDWRGMRKDLLIKPLED